MSSPPARAPVQPGEPAPDFTLPTVNRDGVVSLSDYRGTSPVLLAVDRGLYCPFCRRHIAQLEITQERLRAVGVETLVVVATELVRARLYVRYRPTPVLLASDPGRLAHRAFGVPSPEATPELIGAAQEIEINPTGELPGPMPIAVVDPSLSAGDNAQLCFFAGGDGPIGANAALNRLDGFEPTPTDRDEAERQFPQLNGQFLIDRDGIVRWAHIECATQGLAGAGKFPTDDELIAAARTLGG